MLFCNIIMLLCIIATLIYVLLCRFVILERCFVRYNDVSCVIMLLCTVTILFVCHHIVLCNVTLYITILCHVLLCCFIILNGFFVCYNSILCLVMLFSNVILLFSNVIMLSSILLYRFAIL